MTENENLPVTMPDLSDMLPVATDLDIDAALQSGEWLPRIQFMSASSEKVKNGEFTVNHFALVRNQVFTNLGPTVDVFCLSFRTKAMEFGSEVLIVYDPKVDPMTKKATGEFRRIQELAETEGQGYMYGLEFLLWVPAIKTYVTFFMGSPSMRRDAPLLTARVQQRITLISHPAKTKKHSWVTPSCTDCSTPFDLPTIDEIREQVERFNHPPESEIVEEIKPTERER